MTEKQITRPAKVCHLQVSAEKESVRCESKVNSQMSHTNEDMMKIVALSASSLRRTCVGNPQCRLLFNKLDT